MAAHDWERTEWRIAAAELSELDRAHHEPDHDEPGNQPGGYLDAETLCRQLENDAQRRRERIAS